MFCLENHLLSTLKLKTLKTVILIENKDNDFRCLVNFDMKLLNLNNVPFKNNGDSDLKFLFRLRWRSIGSRSINKKFIIRNKKRIYIANLVEIGRAYCRIGEQIIFALMLY